MIRFENVTKVYPRSSRPALRDINLEVGRGEFVFIVGQSGSGKSTLLRLALREERATQGNVLVAGHELGRLPHRKVPRLRREIGTVFQDFRLLPNKNVYQNVAFALQVLGRPGHAVRQVVPETLGDGRARRQGEAAAASSPVVSSSAWRSPGPSSTSPRSCSPTSRREPRPHDEHGHRAAPGPDQPHGHHDRHGHPRRRHRRPAARKRVVELDQNSSSATRTRASTAPPPARATSQAATTTRGTPTHATAVHPQRDLDRVAPQPVHGHLGGARDDGVHVPARPGPARPAPGRHLQGLLVRPRRVAIFMCTEDSGEPACDKKSVTDEQKQAIAGQLEEMKPLVERLLRVRAAGLRPVPEAVPQQPPRRERQGGGHPAELPRPAQ